MRIVLLCATQRGDLFLQKLAELLPLSRIMPTGRLSDSTREWPVAIIAETTEDSS